MKKSLYYLRVFFISFEFFTILLSFVLFDPHKDNILSFIEVKELNSDALLWIIGATITASALILREAKKILIPSDAMKNILYNFPDLWKIKAHCYSGIFWAIISSLICLLIWVNNYFTNQTGIYILITCVIVQGVNLLSFYFAEFSFSIILSKAKK